MYCSLKRVVSFNRDLKVEDSTVLAADMLEEAGVAVTSGVDFEDPSTGVVFVEISSI